VVFFGRVRPVEAQSCSDELGVALRATAARAGVEQQP
jgi:hypothetical protein